ncbi:AAA family ATPase [Helicobacter pylori]|uniref:AAA family ATPase n=1 Tax=Helicobacter pylori TaxID=210 RepID=UPI0002BB20F5|nr:ATP/GTP-binding protein [Helicobacter pylori]EMH10109.1 RecF/RecN/SMC protein [Helicobacter pylori GAM250AFi]EMH14594.1 RecF/RecN/SMC protein [Helicobacter pylori GAM252Bi]EMH15182.1 RecF/RecN/SMC protein [Helicobacter pylori GAM250T]EMH15484.1 RecF/RecN/SMC protein [Helicobacter pylori GAM252T]EMH47836.1 RecF/RecN/SMC protein [Helicobacter pylori HP250AFii]
MIQSVRIKNFKTFKDTQIDGFTKLNIITGGNNVGKSNLLEALYCLVGKSMHPCANITEIYDNIRKEPLTSESKNLMFYGLDTEKEIQIVTTLDNNQTLDLQIKFIASENQKVIESQIILTAEQTQMSSQLNFTLKKNNEEIYNDHLNIAKVPNFPPIPNQSGYNRQFKNFDPNQLQKLLPFESAVIIPSDVVYRQAHMIQAVSKICSNNQLEEELNKHLNQFDNNIQSISFNTNNQLKLKVKNIKEKVPLSVFGDGLIKYLYIVSAFMADNAKTIYIDEVENGLHFSRMKLLLRCVIDFINDNKDGNLQVFMTTHNQEFIEILDQVIREKDFAHQTKLFCLEQYDDLIVTESYYGENLSLYFKNGANLFGGKERFKENNYE